MEGAERPPSSLAPGVVIDGKYRLVAARGSGAMGSVWHAQHAALGYAVAIKFLHKAMVDRRDARGRFEREAKLAARLGESSKHMTKVLDHGVLDTGMPYLVMELLEGEGLDARLAREKRLPPLDVADIARQLARALEIAHEQHIVHRDLKPANVFLCNDEEGELLVKLLDFGVAKATIENVSFATTQSGAFIGTPSYMSPEQIRPGSEVDARSDLWALGVCVYRMLTGELPFGRGPIEELAIRIVAGEPPAPSTHVASLPPAIDAWMRRALEKRPADRFPDARTLATELDRALGIVSPQRRATGAPPRAVAQTTSARPLADTIAAISNSPTEISAPPSDVVDLAMTAIPATLASADAPFVTSAPVRDEAPLSTVAGVPRRGSRAGTFAAIGGAAVVLGAIVTVGVVAMRPRTDVVRAPAITATAEVVATTSGGPLEIATIVPSAPASAAPPAASHTSHAARTGRVASPTGTTTPATTTTASVDPAKKSWEKRDEL